MAIKKKTGEDVKISSDIAVIKKALDNAENQIRLARKLLLGESYFSKAKNLKPADEKCVEGIFDGECMVGSDKKKYAVPPNYASKSKLVPGDGMKLKIAEDGMYKFKQITQVKRKRVTGILSEDEGNYYVNTEGSIYRILPACVSFHKAKDGDKVTLIAPCNEPAEWAVMDNVLRRN